MALYANICQIREKYMNNFYAMLSRMKYINRWALMRNTYTENISEHSLEVAMLAHALAVIGNKRLGKQLDADRQRLHQEKEEFRKLRERVPVQRHAPVLEYRQGIFFKGVTDEKGLKKRYKDLIKVFHPDNFNGDNVTLQNINREYETLLHDLEMNR